MESVRGLVFFSSRRPPKMHDWSSAFLQERLERRLSPSTLKVYVAAVAAHHDAVDGRSLGKYDLIVRFLKGARRMNPSRGLCPLGTSLSSWLNFRGAPLSRSLSATEGSRKGRLSPNRGWPTGYWRPSPWRTSRKASRAPWGWGLTPPGVLPPPMCWRTAPLWQTSAELRAGNTEHLHKILQSPHWASFFPCVGKVMGGKNWPVSRLLRHSPSPGDTSSFFSPPVQFPGRWTLVESSKHPDSQTGRSSLTPGPVLVLARPGLRSAPVLG